MYLTGLSLFETSCQHNIARKLVHFLLQSEHNQQTVSYCIKIKNFIKILRHYLEDEVEDFGRKCLRFSTSFPVIKMEKWVQKMGGLMDHKLFNCFTLNCWLVVLG